MGKNVKGLKDGTGFYKDSYQSKVNYIGKRKEKGEKCSFTKEEGSKIIKW